MRQGISLYSQYIDCGLKKIRTVIEEETRDLLKSINYI